MRAALETILVYLVGGLTGLWFAATVMRDFESKSQSGAVLLLIAVLAGLLVLVLASGCALLYRTDP